MCADDFGGTAFEYTDASAWVAPLQQVAAMDNPREQVLGQFGSVTGPAKVLEVLQDGVSFEHAVSAGRHLWKAIQVVIAVVWFVRETLFSTTFAG